MILEVDGSDVFVFTAGRAHDPDLETVVFVHGAGQDHTLWRLVVRRLAAAGWNAMAIDLPAHGRSGGDPLRSIPDMASWLASALGRIGVERVAVVGHSMGALISMHLAERHPQLASHLVLTGAAGAMPVHPELLELASRGDPTAVELVVGWVHTGPGRMGRAVQPGTWEPGMSRRLMGSSLEVLSIDLAACDAHRSDGRASVSCPVVVVAGEADRMTPARAARQLVETLPDATLITVPAVGHDVPTRAVDTLVGVIENLSDHRLG